WIRDGSTIGSATASTYTLASADLGHTINCVVTATNTYGGIAGGSTSHSSSNGQLIMSPINTTAPVATPGATSASVDPGTWIGSGTITYTFVWSVCPDGTGLGCGSAPGSTDGTTGTYTYDVSDISGTFLKVTVTATDSVGQTAVDSNVIQVP